MPPPRHRSAVLLRLVLALAVADLAARGAIAQEVDGRTHGAAVRLSRGRGRAGIKAAPPLLGGLTQSCACTSANGNLNNGGGSDCPADFDLFNVTNVNELDGPPEAFIPDSGGSYPVALNPSEYFCKNAVDGFPSAATENPYTNPSFCSVIPFGGTYVDQAISFVEAGSTSSGDQIVWSLTAWGDNYNGSWCPAVVTLKIPALACLKLKIVSQSPGMPDFTYNLTVANETICNPFNPEDPCINERYNTLVLDTEALASLNLTVNETKSVVFEMADCECTDSGAPCCYLSESENIYRYSPAGTTCRAASGPCDMPEVCDGVISTCPDDQRRAPGAPCSTPEHPCKRGECDGVQDRCLIDGHRPDGSKCHWTKLPHGVVWPRAAAMSVMEDEEAEEVEANDDEQAAAVTARLGHHKYPVCHGKCRRGRCHGSCPADKHKTAGAKPHDGTADNKTPTKAGYEL